MPTRYEFEFLPEGRVERWFGTRGNCYRLADGSEINLDTTPVWCRRCGKITDGERVESLSDIDKLLADLNDPSTLVYQMWTNNAVHELIGGGERRREEQLNKVRMRRRWRETRISPPRCIKCGSTDLRHFQERETVNNPTGPGTVTMTVVGHVSTGWTGWVFSPEGERIPGVASSGGEGYL